MKINLFSLLLCLLLVGTVWILSCSDLPIQLNDHASLSISLNYISFEKTGDGQPNPFAILAVMLTFSAMLLLPFWPGLRESLWPRDEYPLPIKMQYSKDPRHLGKSFRRILNNGIGDKPFPVGLHSVRLSKEEDLDFKTSGQFITGETATRVLVVQGDLSAQSEVTFKKEVYVRGAADFGDRNSLRSLACDGDVVFGEGARITRWVDAEGDVRVGAGSTLGVNCAAAGRLLLESGVEFKRLFGSRIQTPGFTDRFMSAKQDIPLPKIEPAKIKTIEDITNYRRTTSLLMSGTVIDQNLIVKGSLDLADGVTVHGDIRSMGQTIIGKNSVVFGDVFAEGPIEILQDAVVLGNVFSQNSVHIFAGARVGKANCTKSVIAKKRIVLEDNVAIYGYVLTEGEGRVA